MNPNFKRMRPFGACGLLIVSLQAQAGGFALIEHGASGMGNAYAGAAAVSSDTSTAWFNPAGMTELDSREISVTLHGLTANTDFTNEGTSLNQLFGGGDISGSDTASPGTTTVLPNLYYVAPINDKLSYGLSIGVPFGSSTEYEDDWVGRYTTTESGVQTLDINPSIAYRVSDKVRIGAGISYQRLSANLANEIDSGAVCLGAASQLAEEFSQAVADAATANCINIGLVAGVRANDSSVKVEGDSDAFSFNIGALFLPRPDTKIGVAYRHSISHELEGDANFDNNATFQAVLDASLAANPDGRILFRDSDVTAEVDLPASLSVSATHQLNDKILLLGDITWTGWSSFEELRVTFDDTTDQPDSFSTQDWEDVFRIAAGISFQQSAKLLLRGGLALDEEPIPSPERRTARIPGNDRTWVSFGAGYQVNKQLSFDVGYSHLFFDETPINNPNSESEIGTTVRGLYDSSADILSAQVNWKFN